MHVRQPGSRTCEPHADGLPAPFQSPRCCRPCPAAGFTYELCAGIVDKPGLNLAQITREEVGGWPGARSGGGAGGRAAGSRGAWARRRRSGSSGPGGGRAGGGRAEWVGSRSGSRLAGGGPACLRARHATGPGASARPARLAVGWGCCRYRCPVRPPCCARSHAQHGARRPRPAPPQILEECGYDVPLDRIRPVTSYLSGAPRRAALPCAPRRAAPAHRPRSPAWPSSSQAHAARRAACPCPALPCRHVRAAIGISGSRQTIFAAEVDDSQAVAPAAAGGGLRDHGEAIEVRLPGRGAVV